MTRPHLHWSDDLGIVYHGYPTIQTFYHVLPWPGPAKPRLDQEARVYSQPLGPLTRRQPSVSQILCPEVGSGIAFTDWPTDSIPLSFFLSHTLSPSFSFSLQLSLTATSSERVTNARDHFGPVLSLVFQGLGTWTKRPVLSPMNSLSMSRPARQCFKTNSDELNMTIKEWVDWARSPAPQGPDPRGEALSQHTDSRESTSPSVLLA